MRSDQTTFDAKTEAVIEKVRKLLALANSNDNEHQAETAANKARELLEAHNLDMAHIGKEGGGYAPRDKQRMNGGLYNWQRDIWHMTAQLNFCKYWYYKGTKAGSKYEHELLGSKANVISTRIMADYLQGTIERLAREWVAYNRPNASVFIKEAIAYREGIASRLITRMLALRTERVKAEQAKVKEEREANAQRGVYTKNALTLSDVISTEEDLNNDHIFGWEPGRSARERKAREERQRILDNEAAELLRQQQEYDLAHPEEAAKRKAKEKAEEEERWLRYKAKNGKARTRKPTPEEERRQMGSYYEGYDKGADISLDKQVDVDKRRLLK